MKNSILVFMFSCMSLNSYLCAQFIPVSDPILANALCIEEPATMSGDCLSLDTIAAATVTGTLQMQNYGFTNVQELRHFKNISFYQTVNNNTIHLPNLNGFSNLTAIDLRGNPWNSFEELYPVKNQLSMILMRRVGENNEVSDFSFLNDFPNLQSIQFQNFNATILPDFSQFSGLALVSIKLNKFTFKDLLPLTSLSGYESFLQAMPQKQLTNDSVVNTFCNSEFHFTIPIDVGLSGITYEFYKDSVLKQSSSSNVYRIDKVEEVDSGEYYVHIRSNHPFFVNDFLTTGKIKLNVNSITNCNDLFTPNNDGIDDLLRLKGSGEATIRNKQGVVIRTISLPGEWDGKDKNGNPVDVGLYSISSEMGIETVTLLR